MPRLPCKIFRLTFASTLSLILLLGSAPAQPSVRADASLLEQSGKFAESERVLRDALKSNDLPVVERKRLEFELDRLNRIRLDFTLTEDQLFGVLQKSVKELTRDEFDSWVKEGRFEGRVIDGTMYYVGVSRSNLFWRYPDAAARRIGSVDRSAFEKSVWEDCVAIEKASREEGKPYVLPKRFDTKMVVKVRPNAVPAGELVRAWIPIPRSYPYQRDFKIVGTLPPVQTVGADESPIRSAFFEQKASADRPVEFKIEYTYVHDGVRFELDPAKAEPSGVLDAAVRKFTEEGPHVVFTDRVKNLSAQVAGNETNPVVIARKFYDWLTDNVKYSYALEYSTIRNISDYCLTNMWGDCGEESLLYITLCRYRGIPARWQSGWFTFPGGKVIHDWAEIYIRPWGWVPVDPYMGILAVRYFQGLTGEQKQEVRRFYFGGLDQYRVAANGDHSQTLDPPKRSMRSDDVDFQRGEVEYGETNIYFDKYSYDLEIQEIEASP